MRFTFILICYSFSAFLSVDAKDNYMDPDEIEKVFLNINHEKNTNYSLTFYDSLEKKSTSHTDIFFCHVAKSLRYAISDISEATQELILAKTLFAKHKDLSVYQAHLSLAEANMYSYLSKYEKADLLFNEASNLFSNSDQTSLALISQLRKVYLLTNWRKFDRAQKLLDSLFKVSSPDNFSSTSQFQKYEMGLWNRKSTLYTTLANVDSDSLALTMDILKTTIDLARKRGDDYVYSNATGNLSYIYYLKKEYEKMIPLALEDLVYSESKNSVESIGGLHTVLADAYFNLGNMDSTEYHLKKAEQYSKYLRNKYMHGAFVEIARKFYSKSGNIEAAFQSLDAQYAAINAIYKSIAQINFDLSKAENDLTQAEERIQMLDLKNRQSIVINWLLALLALSVGLLAFNFYRLQYSQRKFRKKLVQINQNLEIEVERRTKEVVEQSEKIKAAAYHNSHRTRAPVARLLGLVDILNTEILSEREEIAEYIRQSAREIDEVIIDMNEVLSSDSK